MKKVNLKSEEKLYFLDIFVPQGFFFVFLQKHILEFLGVFKINIKHVFEANSQYFRLRRQDIILDPMDLRSRSNKGSQ